jgi:uncharacterized RDD family membrane protein YckC
MAGAGSPQATTRAGFWRRALALAIDVVVVAFIVTVAGTILFALTGGQVRLSTALIDTVSCAQVDPQQLVLPNPPPFRITHAERCTKRFFGYVHDRTLRVSEVTQSDSVTYIRAVTYPVGADGRLVPADYIDFMIYVLLVVYVLVLEWRFGRTIGKRLVGIRVQSLGGGAMTFEQAVKRSVIRFLPWPLFMVPFVLPLFTSYDAFFSFMTSTNAQAIMLIFIVAVLVFVGNFVKATRRRELPWDDRWARTEVVQD